MENHGESARYGYHVQHILIAGSVCGAAMVVLGGILLLGGLVHWLPAVTAVAVGAVFLAFTVGLGWFVYRGRPLIT